MESPKKQKGMTLIGWIIVVVIGVTAFLTMIRLVPPYLESMSVQSALESVANEPSIKRMSAFKVQELLTRRLYINDVKHVKASDLEISREGDVLTFSLKYEVRVHAIGNIDAVLRFDQKASSQ